MEAIGKVNEAPAITLSKVEKFHKEGRYWDVQLQVKTEIFKSQRSLLAGMSEYFETMFSCNLKESNTGCDEPIILHEMDATAFKEILHFMYTGDICVTDSNIYLLLFMSDFLRLRTAHIIEEQCIQYIRSRFPEPEPMIHAIDLISFACVGARNDLLCILSAYICQRLRHYSEDAKFMEISIETLNALLKCMKDYILPFPCAENCLLKIILKWLNHSRGERSKYQGELMKNIDFSKVSSNIMQMLINTYENFVNNLAAVSRVNELPAILKKFETEMVTDVFDSTGTVDAQFKATIIFEAKNVSQMKVDGFMSSTPCVISHLFWKINIARVGEYFAFYLTCEGTSEVSAWNCCAEVDLMMVSQKERVENVIKKCYRGIFSSELTSRGEPMFLKWDEVIAPEKGYLYDDAVICMARVRTDIPFRTDMFVKDLHISK